MAVPVAAATDVERGVFTDAVWAPYVTALRERWHAADQAAREVETLEVYSTHWIADEPGDTVLWPRHMQPLAIQWSAMIATSSGSSGWLPRRPRSPESVTNHRFWVCCECFER